MLRISRWSAGRLAAGSVHRRVTPATAPHRRIAHAHRTRRLAEAVVAALGLAILFPLLALIALAIVADSGRPVFFRQARVGRRFRPFRIWKFRTMRCDAPSRGPSITSANDERITRIGRLLRRTKLDELPQLLNVVAGDMSLVGPRPEVPRYVDLFRAQYSELLEVRPGITDIASLAYIDEAAVLAGAADPEVEYMAHTLPAKIRLSRIGIERSSLLFDGRVLLATVLGLGRQSLVAGFALDGAPRQSALRR